MENWNKQRIVNSKAYQMLASEEVNGLIVAERNGKKIILTDGRELIEFMSCSYLGLDQDPRILGAVSRHLSSQGMSFPVSRTRLRLLDLVKLEDALGKIFCGFATTFTSLHLAHQGMLPLLASGELPSFPVKKGMAFILDKSVHSSVQSNIFLLKNLGETNRLHFHEEDALEELFKKAYLTKNTPIALSDGIGSMGGRVNIKKLLELADKYEGYVYIDDAHGTSIYGEHGAGYILRELGCFHKRLILTTSLSKGFGTNGGVIIVPTSEDDRVIKMFANPYIFSNPMATPIIEASLSAAEIHLSDEIYTLQKKLQERISKFDVLTEKIDPQKIINYKMDIPIKGIKIGEERLAIRIVSEIQKDGFALSAVTFPSVPVNQSIIRISLGVDHSMDEITRLCSFLINHVQ